MDELEVEVIGETGALYKVCKHIYPITEFLALIVCFMPNQIPKSTAFKLHMARSSQSTSVCHHQISLFMSRALLSNYSTISSRKNLQFRRY